MTRVTINGYELHQVQMLMEPYPNHKNTASYLMYPEHRMETKRSGDQMEIRMPGFLALELYRRGIMPQNPAESFALSLDSEEAGRFVMTDFRYPNSHGAYDMVRMTLKRVDGGSPAGS